MLDLIDLLWLLNVCSSVLLLSLLLLAASSVAVAIAVGLVAVSACGIYGIRYFWLTHRNQQEAEQGYTTARWENLSVAQVAPGTNIVIRERDHESIPWGQYRPLVAWARISGAQAPVPFPPTPLLSATVARGRVDSSKLFPDVMATLHVSTTALLALALVLKLPATLAILGAVAIGIAASAMVFAVEYSLVARKGRSAQ